MAIATGDVARAQTLQLDPDQAVETEAATPETPAEAATTEAAEAAAVAEAAAEAAQAPRATTTTFVIPGPVAFQLRRIDFANASSYFTSRDFGRVATQLYGNTYTAATVGQIGAAITALYQQAGILTAQAVVTNVDPGAGAVTVRLVEARLSGVRVGENESNISEEYIRYRLGVRAGDLADTRLLNERLERLFVTDGLTLDIGFQPGEQNATTRLSATPIGFPPRVTTVTVDNFGPESTGEIQAQFSHVITSLTGWADPLSLSVTAREGFLSGSVGYSRVVTPNGGRLGFSLSRSRSDGLQTPPVDGDSWNASVSYTQPFIATSARQLSLTVAAERFAETSEFLGTNILDQEGTELSFALNGFLRGEGRTFSGGLTFFSGSYDDNVANSTNDYAAVRGNLNVLQLIGQDFVIGAALSGQDVLSGTLPSLRSFDVTDVTAVRGYPTSLSSGSSGYVLRLQAEKASPYELSSGALGVLLTPFAFYDVGEAYDASGVGLGQASSVGAGVNFGVGERVFGTAFVAKPLETNITGWTNPSDDPMLGVSLGTRF